MKISANADGGPRSQVCNTRPSAQPQSTLADIFRRMCLGRGAKKLKYSDQFSKHFSFSRGKNPKISTHPPVGRYFRQVVPNFFLTPNLVT